MNIETNKSLVTIITPIFGESAQKGGVRGFNHEKNVSAQQTKTRQNAWFQKKNVYQAGAENCQPAQGKGKKKTGLLS